MVPSRQVDNSDKRDENDGKQNIGCGKNGAHRGMTGSFVLNVRSVANQEASPGWLNSGNRSVVSLDL